MQEWKIEVPVPFPGARPPVLFLAVAGFAFLDGEEDGSEPSGWRLRLEPADAPLPF
jgi:hypothetical protein